MKISVIVSTYNRPDTLVKVLDGLNHQTRLPDEIIVADDGSTHETRQAIESYLSDSQPRCIHVRHEDEGFRLARIRNEAIKASSSDYLVFLDGDCIPQCHFVEDHSALAQKGFFFQGKRVIVSQTASPFFSFKDTEKAQDKINELEIKLSYLPHLESDSSQVVVDRVNNSLNEVKDKIGLLQGQIAKQKSGIEKTIQKHQRH